MKTHLQLSCIVIIDAACSALAQQKSPENKTPRYGRYYQRFLFLFFVVTLTTLSSGQVSAADLVVSPTSPNAVIATTDQEKADNLKARATQEVTRRTEAYSQLLNQIPTIDQLTEKEKSSLIAAVQEDLDSLATLRSSIESETTLSSLRKDVLSLSTSHKSFAFLISKVRLLLTAQKLNDVTIQMAEFQAKLQTKIQEASAKGVDTTQSQQAIEKMTTDITQAKANVKKAEDLLYSLTVNGYPSNKSQLRESHAFIISGRQLLADARQQAVIIITSLK